MRKALVAAFMELSDDPDFCLLTGDLGFMVFEDLQRKMGERFINAGIAEQNMLSVAAGLAKQGFRPWVYSIAPFCYARAFEQIRNDIALHDLPVRIVGNGAGYGYGVQGPTHHALEDCCVMRSLQNMEVFAPAFKTDMHGLMKYLQESLHPAYIRIGYDFLTQEIDIPRYSDFRVLLTGNHGIVFTLGSMSGVIYPLLAKMPETQRPSLCVCCTFPKSFNEFPPAIQRSLRQRSPVIVIEEHVLTGGLAECLSQLFCKNGIFPIRFYTQHALGYPSHRYGSQKYYWKSSNLDLECFVHLLKELLEDKI